MRVEFDANNMTFEDVKKLVKSRIEVIENVFGFECCHLGIETAKPDLWLNEEDYSSEMIKNELSKATDDSTHAITIDFKAVDDCISHHDTGVIYE